ncbi:MAG: twin-arginine translocase TatA/TatE family subunit [Acidimicrobiales bacterium]
MLADIFGGDGLIVIVVALIVLVGGSQLPKIARNVGLAGREFKKAQSEAEDEARAAANSRATPPAIASPAVVQTPPAVQAPQAQATQAAGGDTALSLTPAQLDELLKAHEDRVRRESSGN